MKTTISTYQQQGIDFLNNIGVKMTVKFLFHGKYFDGDKEPRDVYSIIFEGENRHPFNLKFGQSIISSGRYICYTDKGQKISMKPLGNCKRNKDFAIPSAYDVLACIQKYDPGTFDNFCWEFGYDTDSRKVEKIYHAVVEEWQKVKAFFTPSEIEQLQEIQ